MKKQQVLKHISLLLVSILVFSGIIYWTGAETPAVEAVVKFNHIENDPFGPKTSEDILSYRRTHAALMKSVVVITAALRQSDVNQLEVIRRAKHPIDFVSSRLTTAIGDSELVGIRLRIPYGQRDKIDQWQTLLDAVVEAYLSEIVNAERLTQIEHLVKARRRLENSRLVGTN